MPRSREENPVYHIVGEVDRISHWRSGKGAFVELDLGGVFTMSLVMYGYGIDLVKGDVIAGDFKHKYWVDDQGNVSLKRVLGQIEVLKYAEESEQ